MYPFEQKPQLTAAEFRAALRAAGFGVEHARIVDTSGRCPLENPVSTCFRSIRADSQPAWIYGLTIYTTDPDGNMIEFFEPRARRAANARRANSGRDPVLYIMGEPEIERREDGDDEAGADHHVHRRRVRTAEDETGLR
jgi:hypothetical protein